MKINKDQLIFLLYLIVLVLLSNTHHIWMLLGSVALLFLWKKKRMFYIVKRVLKALLLSLVVISLSYIFMGLFKPIDMEFLFLLNLRVFTLTLLSMSVLETVNIFMVFAFSKKMTFLIALAYSQMNIFQRIFTEFSMGYSSRSVHKDIKSRLLHIKAVLLYFLNKTFHTSVEITHGMRSRGFYDD